MTTPVSEMQVVRPAALDEALAMLAENPGQWRPVAGGTDLMVGIEAGMDRPSHVMDLWKLDELRGIEVKDGALHIGALATYSEMIHSAEVQKHCPTLVAASREVGAWAIQNRGTLGGNIANASPAADTVPVLQAMGASFELRSSQGSREVHVDDFFHGYKKLELRPDELIARVSLPLPGEDERLWFRKVGTRRAQSISKVVIASRVRATAGEGGLQLSDVRISAGSVAATVIRLSKTEEVLAEGALDGARIEAARVAAEADVTPIDDIRSTEHYRRATAGRIIRRWLSELR